MKTKKQVISENAEFKKLINAVISRIGMDNIENVQNHGISGGYPGFTYYSDTVNFAQRNKKQIIELLENSADSLSEEVVSMVSNFGYFKNRPMDADDKKDLYRYLSGVKCKETTIPNLMAWFAAEEVCRMFED